jgi:hypothetical protein
MIEPHLEEFGVDVGDWYNRDGKREVVERFSGRGKRERGEIQDLP